MSITKKIYLVLYGRIRDYMYTPDGGVISNVVSLPLSLFGQIYFLYTRFRRSLYDRGIFKRQKVAAKVIGIGNLTMGGSGKTTVTMELAEYLRRRDLSIAVVSRGYGGESDATEPVVVSRGNGPLVDVGSAGDEASMMAERLSNGVIVIICRDRVKAALHAIKTFGCNYIVLDDAFQFLSLYKDLEILLINETDLAGRRKPIPAGHFREPLSSSRDADIIVVVRGLKEDGQAHRYRDILFRYGTRTAMARPEKVFFKSVSTNPRELSVEELRGKRIVAFTSIARTDTFRNILENLDPEWLEMREYPDHYRYRSDELEVIRNRAVDQRASILTTEKDRVKISWDLFQDIDCYTVSLSYELFTRETEVKKLIDSLVEGEVSSELQN